MYFSGPVFHESMRVSKSLSHQEMQLFFTMCQAYPLIGCAVVKLYMRGVPLMSAGLLGTSILVPEECLRATKASSEVIKVRKENKQKKKQATTTLL